MNKVLVTAIGTAAATTIVQELKKNNDLYVIGTDIYEKNNIVTSKEVDEFYVFPSSVDNRSKYLNFVLEFCKQHKVRYIFSTVDEEVYDFTKNKHYFEQLGIKLCLPNPETVEICHLKNHFVKWIDENVPEVAICTYDDIEKVSEFPVFVKPVEGRASRGCHSIGTSEELIEFFASNDRKKFVVQKKCYGDIVAVDICRDKNSEIINICQRKELLRNSNGAGIAVEIINDLILNEICKKIAVKLDLNGLINAEFFHTNEGYKIIEINPRFPAGTSYSCMAGVNTVNDVFSIVNGKTIKHAKPDVGKYYARRYETYEL